MISDESSYHPRRPHFRMQIWRVDAAARSTLSDTRLFLGVAQE